MTGTATPRWSPGDELVIGWPGGLALVDGAVGLTTAERIWSRLHRDSQLGTFLKTLSEGSESGFLDLPSFAIAVRQGPRWHIAVRGAVPVDVEVDGQIETLSGEGITTWAERVLTGAGAIRFGVAGESEGAPISDGVVRAGGVALGEFHTSDDAAPADSRRDPVEPEPTAAEEELAAPEPTPGPESVEPGPAAPEPAPVTPVAGEAESAAPGPSAAPVEARPAHTTLADVDVEELADDEAGPEEVAAPNPYDSLWDHSIALDVEAAAIRGEIEEVGPVAAENGAAPAAAPAPSDQMSGDTIADEGLVEVVMPGSGSGPQVLARFCDRGHANPPERATCFVCGAEVAGEARTTSRPQLGWLRIEGGETIPLRGPVVAGRNPRSTAIKLDETPRLVALPHPHVSSTHLAIVIEGWRLMAKDLRSSNGTFLRRHGKPPVRLPETAVPLVPGDLIDLGKGLFLHLDRTP